MMHGGWGDHDGGVVTATKLCVLAIGSILVLLLSLYIKYEFYIYRIKYDCTLLDSERAMVHDNDNERAMLRA